MARSPETQSKTGRLVFIPLDKDDEKLSNDFKTLCQQDDVTIHDLLYEAIQLCFKVHHWPPGNPQLTLSNYQVKLEDMGHCGYSGCKHKAIAKGVYLPKNQEFKLCKLHYESALNASKVWSFP
jgi:hypothetical protein